MRKKMIPATIAAIILLALSCLVRADDKTIQNDEAIKLAGQMTDAMARQDTAAAEKLLDTNALFDRLSAGVNASPAFQAGFKESFAPQAGIIMDNIVRAAGESGYHFLRIQQINGETHILFRILPKGGGMNYHDWIAGKDPQGHLKFQDAYIAITGELISQTMHRTYLQGAIANHPGLIERLAGKDKDLAANFSKLSQIADDTQNAQFQKVLDDYKALPKSMQEDKSCMVFRLMATEKLRKQSPQEYTDAMADYQRLFPGDPSVDLDCIDALFESKKFVEARQSLDHLDAFTGGDAYLLILRGNSYRAEGGNDNLLLAKQSFQKAVEKEPTLALAYWSLVTLSLDAQKYDETAALLTEIQQKLHLKIKDLTTVPIYAGFVKSAAYKKWLAAQPPAH